MDLLKQAATAVPDPAPPKIKLKVGQSAEQPTPSKKITIHVGSGGRGGSTEAATPQTGPSADSPKINGANNSQAQTSLAPGDSARSASAAAPSPSPSVPPLQKSEDATSAASPAVRPTSAASGQITPATGSAQPQLPPQPVVPPAPVIPMEQKRLRASGKGEL